MPEDNNSFSIFDESQEHSIATGTKPVDETEKEDPSDIVVTEEVIAVVAGKAASSLECVASMSANVATDLVESFGVINPTKGVVVTIDGDGVQIDVYVIVKYGKKFSDIAWDIQEAVKTSVENLTGAIVTSVNVHVQGVDFDEN